MIKETIKKIFFNLFNGHGLYWRAKTCNKCVALTFDDGPHKKYTPLVLDILKSANAYATFFLVGEKIQSNEHIVERIIKEGHEIGNHTFTHSELPTSRWKEFKNEIIKTDSLLKRKFNITTRYFRLPKGNWNYLILLIIIILKKKLIFWNVDPRDYKAKSSSEIIINLKTFNIKYGDIVLLHDKNEYTVNALTQIIKDLRSKGLKPVSLSELFVK